MLESPQKKPRLYGVTAFNSHAKNGMEADEMWERKGGEADKRQKDGLINECEHVFVQKKKKKGKRWRYRDASVSQEDEGSSFKKCQSSGNMISRFLGMKHSTHSCFPQRIREKEG